MTSSRIVRRRPSLARIVKLSLCGAVVCSLVYVAAVFQTLAR